MENWTPETFWAVLGVAGIIAIMLMSALSGSDPKPTKKGKR
jgi:hypothetical protein